MWAGQVIAISFATGWIEAGEVSTSPVLTPNLQILCRTA